MGVTPKTSKDGIKPMNLPETVLPGTLALVGFPTDAGSSFLQGPALAPQRIREAFWSPSRNTTTEGGLDLAREPRLIDLGDVELDAADGARRRATIERTCGSVLERGGRLLSLGGDHSISHPILLAHGKAHGGLGTSDLTVLQIDAHADLYDRLDGDEHSNASPFARAFEAGAIGRMVQVGIRTLTTHQRQQAEKFGVEIITMRDFYRGARPELKGPIYLTLDLDGIDPAFTPGVSHQEPGGLSTRDVIDLIQELPPSLVGADVVELNPIRDPDGATAMVAAKLMGEIAHRMFDSMGGADTP